jgi:hypothetical protein
MNTLENSSRCKLGGKIVLKCKGNRAYPKAKQRHGLLLTKPPPNSQSSQDMRLFQFWQPRGVPEL